MSLAFLFQTRFRGFRVIEIVAFGCLVSLVFVVYFSKAHAGRETSEIGDVDQQIADTEHRVRLLNAELAHLETPARLEALSQQYLNLAPISAKHETPDTGLMEVARAAAEPPPTTKASAAKAKPAPVKVSTPAAPATPTPQPGATL